MSSTSSVSFGDLVTVQIMVLQVANPSLQISIPRGQSHFAIAASPQPIMPTIVANVQINASNQNVATTQFTWQAEVTFGGGASHQLSDYKVTALGQEVRLDSNVWDTAFVGGDLQLTVTATVDGKKVIGTLDGLTISGDNPDPQSVLNYILQKQPPSNWPAKTNYNYGRVLGGIAYQASVNHSLEQFDENGNPVISRDYGVGIMQLTNPAPVPNQFWNWQQNIDGV